MKQLRNILKLILSFLPTPIPTGKTAFDAWLNDIVELTGPIADDRAMKWVVSNEVMVVPSGADRVPKRRFVKRLRKFAANQIAASVVQEIKAAQEAEQKQAGDSASKNGECPPNTTN